MADIIKLNSQVTSEATNVKVTEPKIIKIAKIVLLLSDTEIPVEDRVLYVKAGIRMGYFTKEEAAQLLMYRTDLEKYLKDDDEE